MSRKVVFLINSLAGGGAERALCNLLQNSKIQLEQASVNVLLLDTEDQAYQVSDCVQVHSLDSSRSLSRSIVKLFYHLRSGRPEVVVSSLTRSNLANILVSKCLGYRTIICEHAHTSGHHKGSVGAVARLLIRLLYRHADRVVCVSQGIKSDLVKNFGLAEGAVSVISNPIDIREIRHLGEAPIPIDVGNVRYILGMGRFVKSKNFPLLIEAFSRSAFSGKLMLLGQGPDEKELIALCKRLGIEQRVIFLGFHRNPFPFIKNAVAFVLPSNGEGLPTSIIEALALSTPVISTDCHSGPSEILDDAEQGLVKDVYHSKFGILVPPNDVPAMTKAISLLEDVQQVITLQAAAARGADRYGLSYAVEGYWREIGTQLEKFSLVQP